MEGQAPYVHIFKISFLDFSHIDGLKEKHQVSYSAGCGGAGAAAGGALSTGPCHFKTQLTHIAKIHTTNTNMHKYMLMV